MSVESYSQRLFEALTNGDRPSARAIIDECFRDGASAEQVVSELFWPTYEQIETLFREDKLTTLAHHMATRLLRSLCDQAAQRFSFKNPIGRSVFAVCGPTDADELAGQMAADLHGATPARFRFRSLSAIFDDADFTINAEPHDTGLRLWTAKVGGPLAMEAFAEW